MNRWKVLGNLERFYVVTGDTDRDRTLHRVHRYHQTVLAVARKEDAFYTVERSTTDPYALSNFQIAKRRPFNALVDNRAYRVNLFFRNGQAVAAHPDKSKNAFYPKDFGAFFRRHCGLQEY